MIRLTSLALAATLAACGSSKGDSGSDDAPAAQEQQQPAAPAPSSPDADAPAHHSLYVDAAALPACDAAGEGWLVYVKAESTFKVCSAGAWTNVDIKGPKGEDGVAKARDTWDNPAKEDGKPRLRWRLASLSAPADAALCHDGEMNPSGTAMQFAASRLPFAFPNVIADTPANNPEACVWVRADYDPSVVASYHLAPTFGFTCALAADAPRAFFCVTELP